MSLNSELTRIETAKEDIKDAIEEMGGEVGEGTIDTYATAVRSIPTGVGTETDPVFTNSPAYGITSNDITSWNGKSTFSGSYNDLTNKPTIQDAFIVTMDANQNGITASHTPAEIKEAIDSGKVAFLKNLFYITGEGQANTLIPIVRVTSTQAIASSSLHDIESPNDTPLISTMVIDSQKNVTDYGNFLLTEHQDISSKENASNKVTSISSSSTDTQYPSAKCVYDNLITKQDLLVSGTNIKTINNQSILGSGNITISGGSSSPYIYTGTDTQTDEDEFISLYENYMSTGNWDLKRIAYKNTSNVIDAQIPMVGATYLRRQYNIYDICEFYFAGYSVNANTGNQNFIFVEVVCTFNISNETTTVGIACTEEVLSKEATSESIAPIYTKGNTYAVGDYVMSNGKLYVCNTAISSAGAWVNESSKWTQTTIIDVIKNL